MTILGSDIISLTFQKIISLPYKYIGHKNGLVSSPQGILIPLRNLLKSRSINKKKAKILNHRFANQN